MTISLPHVLTNQQAGFNDKAMGDTQHLPDLRYNLICHADTWTNTFGATTLLILLQRRQK